MLKRVNDRFIKILNKLQYKELNTTNFDEFTSDIDATIASLVDLKETDKKIIDEDFLNDLEALVDEIHDNNWDINNLDFDDINKRLKKWYKVYKFKVIYWNALGIIIVKKSCKWGTKYVKESKW